MLALLAGGLPYGQRPADASRSSANANTGGAATATSFIYPVGSATIQPTWDPGNSNGYFITQGFNTSCDPSANEGYYLYGLYYCGHTGVDLASATASATVHATAAGMVVSAGYNGGYGVMVRIRHFLPDGSVMYSQYEHMAYGSLSVYNGEIVTQGQALGQVGATGFATGAHLHFEIKAVDEDGWGYTFGNSNLIAGYVEPLSFVTTHQLRPATFIPSSGVGAQVFAAESEALLKHFLQSYRHFVVVKISDGLHLRSGPGLKYQVLGTALRGAKLGYVHTKGTWIQVALPQNVKGWVSRDYVTGYQDWDALAAARRRAVWPPPGPVATVNVIGLNVRVAAGENHSILTSVFQGDRVALLSLTTNWAYIATRDGSKGWVLRRFLNEPGRRAGTAPVYLVPAVPLLHVRNGPGLQYPVTGAVFGGTKMQVVRNTPNWAAVVLPGSTTGWVARPLTQTLKVALKHLTPARLITSLATNDAALIARATFITVTTPILNIRSGPGQRHAVIAHVKEQTSLQVLALTSHWAHVALPASNIDGWVLRSLTH